MLPSDIIAHKIDRIGPNLPRGTHDVSMRHFVTGADMFTDPRLRGSLFALVPGPSPAYGALEQSVGVTFRIERAQRPDCLSRGFSEMRLVNPFTGCVAGSLIFFDNIIQLP
jgi:hypothetical protein